MKFHSTLLFIVFGLTSIGCSSSSSKLEEAQFALDEGNYSGAIDKANDALASDSSLVEAYRIIGDAHFGLSGLDFLDIEEVLVDLDSSDESNFAAIAGAMPADGDLDEVRLAIESLQDTPNIDDTDLGGGSLADTGFDLAFMQAIEHFALGVYGSNFYETMDVTLITDEQAETVLNDLIEFDNTLLASGVASSEDFIAEVRQTFCILEPLSAGEGFTTDEYQALVGCQLDPDAFDPTTVTATIASCDDLDPDAQSAAVEDCYGEDTAL